MGNNIEIFLINKSISNIKQVILRVNTHKDIDNKCLVWNKTGKETQNPSFNFNIEIDKLERQLYLRVDIITSNLKLISDFFKIKIKEEKIYLELLQEKDTPLLYIQNIPNSIKLHSYSYNKGHKPVYLIAHRCNDKAKIKKAMFSGSNALECDVRYNSNQNQFYINHDFAIGTILKNWMQDFNKIYKLFQNQFALIVFDCKFANSNTQKTEQIILKFRNKVAEYLITQHNTKLYVIYSFPYFKYRKGFESIQNQLKPYEGISIDQSNKVEKIEDYFLKKKTNNIWYANGTPVFLPTLVLKNIKKACFLRDKNKIIKKVFTWTLISEKKIQKYYEIIGVDAIIINIYKIGFCYNNIKKAVKHICKSKKIRLATSQDNPFKVYILNQNNTVK